MQYQNSKVIGFYTIEFFENGCELCNLCVLPEYRHNGIAGRLLEHSFIIAQENGATKMNISIVEENKMLKAWYMRYGFKLAYTKKYNFFLFSCGYLIKNF